VSAPTPDSGPASPNRTVALFNASDDTVEMVQRMLSANGIECLAGCHFADLKKGVVDFAQFLAEHDPQVVIFDISPPYAENWQLFETLRETSSMEKRGLVLTTTNKNRLDETVGANSTAIEIVGKPYDLQQISTAITSAMRTAEAAAKAVPREHPANRKDS
jgi:DNA-binding response OmpR family regulator